MIRFLNPVEGDLLLDGADVKEDGPRFEKLLWVSVFCDGGRIAVNGCEGMPDGRGRYTAAVPVSAGKMTLEAECLETGERTAITAYYLRGAEKTYRFTVDDCIRCFEDLTAHKDDYRSLFENPFLAIFKEAHDRYGSRAHLNVFYESEDGSFNLSQMTDRFRGEFRANADWLSMTFHARSEFPDAPYRNASYEKISRDCEVCVREIVRFAGAEVLRGSTTLHFGACTEDGTRALREFGYQTLCAFLTFDGHGEPIVSYHLTKEQVARAEKREGFYDSKLDVVFPKLDLVLNDAELTADRVVPFLDDLAARPHEGSFIPMVIHEQYFYPDYRRYEPDYARRILTMARWMREHGYRSVSMDELTGSGKAVPSPRTLAGREAADSDEAFAVYRACMYRPDREKYVCALRERRPFVCVQEGRAVGVALVGETGELAGIAVAEDRRRRGVGRFLVEAILREGGFSALQAETDADAVGFYRKCGFETERFVRTFPDGEAERFRCVRRA